MSLREFPAANIVERRGAICTITCGDMPEFPEWFKTEIADIQARLYEEWARIRLPAEEAAKNTAAMRGELSRSGVSVASGS